MSEIETDIIEAQQAIGEWAEANFGTEQPAHFPLLGAGEEIGELGTSVLKRAQGIDDSEKYKNRVGDDVEMDAVGDVFIYTMDFTYRARQIVDMDKVVDIIDDPPLSINDELMKDASSEQNVRPVTIYTMFALYGQYVEVIDGYIRQSPQLDMAVAGLIEFLDTFCDVRGFSFDEAVQSAMDEVLDREWDADVSVT